jgi:hypothetical protein
MDRGTARIPNEGLSQSTGSSWAQEIRDYLLGRLSLNSRTEQLKVAQSADLANIPVRRWWIFEGKRYRMLDGPLAQNWDNVKQNARRLRETFNPRLRLNDRPDGVVDWGQTLARGPYRLRQEYVIRSSGIGLDEQEEAALRGWMQWIWDEGQEYRQGVAIDESVRWGTSAIDSNGPVTLERLRGWAHTAKRSRWPLLHGVVAESLRPVLEPEELDRIPLPADEAKLFELLCLVRVARCIAPLPRELRWLTADTDNTIKLDGVRVCYQQSLDKQIVLGTPEYAGPLASAVKFFRVRTPQFVDLAFDFETTRAGFDGIIMEAKSGAQRYEHTVGQLRTYRSARHRPRGGRYLVWGVIERLGDEREATFDELRDIVAAADQEADLWVFSSGDAISTVLSAVFGTGPGLSLGRAA